MVSTTRERDFQEGGVKRKDDACACAAALMRRRSKSSAIDIQHKILIEMGSPSILSSKRN